MADTLRQSSMTTDYIHKNSEPLSCYCVFHSLIILQGNIESSRLLNFAKLNFPCTDIKLDLVWCSLQGWCGIVPESLRSEERGGDGPFRVFPAQRHGVAEAPAQPRQQIRRGRPLLLKVFLSFPQRPQQLKMSLFLPYTPVPSHTIVECSKCPLRTQGLRVQSRFTNSKVRRKHHMNAT